MDARAGLTRCWPPISPVGCWAGEEPQQQLLMRPDVAGAYGALYADGTFTAPASCALLNDGCHARP